MLLGIIGPHCSGEVLVAAILKLPLGFKRISIHGTHLIDEETHLGDLSLANDVHKNTLYFSSKEEVLDFATSHYQSNFVIVHNPAELESEIKTFFTRPFYCSLGIACSLASSIKLLSQNKMSSLLALSASTASNTTYIGILKQLEEENLSLELYKYSSYTISLNELDYMNDESIAQKFEQAFVRLKTYIRPDWDYYFMEIAKLTSQRSNCMKRRVGAVLASRQFHRLISAGYNGTPSGLPNCFEGGCERCNGNVGSGISLSTCFCLHAEENAIFEAGRDRISLYGKPHDHSELAQKGVILYTTCCPCITCAKKIVHAGISEVVYLDSFHTDEIVTPFLKEANVLLRRIN